VSAANVYISLPYIMAARTDEHAIQILNLLALNFVISTIIVYTLAYTMRLIVHVYGIHDITRTSLF